MSENGEAHYKTYEEHMKTLRAWFVAYGVGGPLLFVTQSGFAATLVSSGRLMLIGTLFLLGVLLQTLVALLNKWVNWGCYHFDDVETENPSLPHRFCLYINDKVWIDIAADVFTLLFFGFATVVVIVEVGRAAGAI